MKIKYKLKNESVQSPEYGQNKAGEPDGSAGNRYSNVGMEEGILQNIKGKLGAAKDWATQKLGIQKPKDPDEYAGITGYLGKLRDKTSYEVNSEVMSVVRLFASKQFANDPKKAKEYIAAKKAALQTLLLDDSADPSSYKDFPEEAKKILDSYFKNKNTTTAQKTSTQKAITQKPAVMPPPPPPEALEPEIIEPEPETLEPAVKYSVSNRTGIYPYYNIISKTQGFPQNVSAKDFDAIVTALGGTEKLAEADKKTKKSVKKVQPKKQKVINKPKTPSAASTKEVPKNITTTLTPPQPKELSYQDISSASKIDIQKVTSLLDFMQDNQLLKNINIELSTKEKQKAAEMATGVNEDLLFENQINRFQKLANIIK